MVNVMSKSTKGRAQEQEVKPSHRMNSDNCMNVACTGLLDLRFPLFLLAKGDWVCYDMLSFKLYHSKDINAKAYIK